MACSLIISVLHILQCQCSELLRYGRWGHCSHFPHHNCQVRTKVYHAHIFCLWSLWTHNHTELNLVVLCHRKSITCTAQQEDVFAINLSRRLAVDVPPALGVVKALHKAYVPRILSHGPAWLE